MVPKAEIAKQPSITRSVFPWSIAIHGGYLESEHSNMPDDLEMAYRAGLRNALSLGANILDGDGPSLDAVETVIKALEDDPLFNAGRGAAFTAQAGHELDASIMDGATLKAGAVLGVTRTRHPISLARKVFEASSYVMMAGEGADAFGSACGLEQVNPHFFSTQAQWQVLVDRFAAQGRLLPIRPTNIRPTMPQNSGVTGHSHSGTVGAVALDKMGHVSAGTSTGGMTGKTWGRIGDSPVIGAGTYASNRSCAISCTGSGEHFIRLSVARTICGLVENKGICLQAAMDEVIHRQLVDIGGQGGAIALTSGGEVAWSYSSNGLFRGRMSEGRPPLIAIFKNEP
jgi:L-asparaginase / beta-aspartyl-peptidase